jgi:hypothetical protein
MPRKEVVELCARQLPMLIADWCNGARGAEAVSPVQRHANMDCFRPVAHRPALDWETVLDIGDKFGNETHVAVKTSRRNRRDLSGAIAQREPCEQYAAKREEV